MADRSAGSLRRIELSAEAMLAAERLAEIAGLPAADLLEVVLLELAESGAEIGARLPRNAANAKSSDRGRPADVIPIERARQAAGAPARPRLARRRRPSRRHSPGWKMGATDAPGGADA
jgi:hypothetical protein